MAFKLENVWYAPLMMIVALTVVLSFLGWSLSSYGVQGDTTKLGSISTSLSSIYGTELSMKEQIQGNLITSGDAVNNMVSGAYTAARNNPFTAATIALNATQMMIQETNLGINPIFYWAFGIVLTVSIVWALIYLVMRYRVY